MKILSSSTFLMSLLATLMLGACDTTNDTVMDVSRDCIVSRVTVGTLNRTLQTVSSTGADSTYQVTVNGAMYPMFIDQLNNRIYNADSLPVGTDVTKVVFADFNVSGTASIKSLYTGKDTIFTAKDSTDFSQPRTLTVHSADGSLTREYQIEIRVHREEADSFVWQKMNATPASPLTQFTQSHAVTANEKIYVYGNTGNGNSQCLEINPKAPVFDQLTATNLPLDIRSVQYFQNTFYALSQGELVRSTDAANQWTQAGVAQHFDALAGHSTDSLYAVSGQQLWASANGTDWTLSTLDTPNALPEVFSTTCVPSPLNSYAETLVMVGTKQGAPVAWKHDIDLRGDFTYPWMFIPQTEELGKYSCPLLQQPTLLTYDHAALLFGLTTEGKPAPFYISRDYGRTWKPWSWRSPQIPGATTLCATVDADHYLWIFCSGTGEVLKGRLNRLGWNEEEDRFE